jgi:thiol-disulfide isomerase/thioredoxin
MLKHSPRRVFCAVLTLAACSSALAARPDVCNVANRRANLDFTLRGTAGNDVKLSSFAGNVILVNFWATWCAPCRQEIPGLIELYDAYRGRGLVILGVSIDSPSTPLEPFVKELEIDYPVLIGGGRTDFQDAFGPPPAYPTSFLVARDGSICIKHIGAASKEDLEEQIVALL